MYKIPGYKIPEYKIIGYKIPGYKIIGYKFPEYKILVYKILRNKIPEYKILVYKILGHKIPGAKYGYKNGVQAFEDNFPAISMHDLRLFYNNDDTPDDIKASVWKHISDFNLINVLA